MTENFRDHRARIDRSRARAWALQILYRWEAGLDHGAGSLRDALVDTLGTRRVSPRRLPYIREVLAVVEKNREEIDARLQESLHNWRLERLSAIDRALLRLAAGEILFMESVPPKVSIQEAILLGEQYGGDDSPSFLNGVLDALYRRLADSLN